MIESDRKTFGLALFGLGVALALGTGPAVATERDCVDSATAIISEMAEKADPSNGRIEPRREAQKLCSLRISPQMREAAARDALNEFFPKEARNYQYLGQIPGLNIYSPSTVIFSKRKGVRIDFRKIDSRARPDQLAFVSVSSNPDASPIVAVSSSPPYHVGLASQIEKGLPDFRRPLKVIATAGHPMAPVLVIQDGRGTRFAYSHSIGRMLSLKELGKLRPNPKHRDPEELVKRRLFWMSYLPDRSSKGKQSQSSRSNTVPEANINLGSGNRSTLGILGN